MMGRIVICLAGFALTACTGCSSAKEKPREIAKRRAVSEVTPDGEARDIADDGTWEDATATSKPKEYVPEITAEPKETPKENGPVEKVEPEIGRDEPDAPEVAPAQWVNGPRTYEYALRHSENGIQLNNMNGDLLLDLAPRFSAVLGAPHAGKRPTAHDWAFDWKQTPDGKWKAQGKAKTNPYEVTLTYSGSPGDPRILAQIRVVYLEDVRPKNESLVFETGPVGNGYVVHRDQRTRAIGQADLVDQWTYKLAFFGKAPSPFALLAGFGVPSMKVGTQDQGAYEIALEFDHHENHPFEVYEACHDKTSTKHAMRHMDELARSRGEEQHYSFAIVMGDPTPLRMSRLPRGYRAALSFTDHADQSSLEKVSALLFGDSQADPASATGGFIGHGLGFTKTVFSVKKGHYSKQLDDSDFFGALFQAVVREPSFEVGSHSPSGLRDVPQEALPTLEKLSAIADANSNGRPGLVWIDHQPDTNCEAITNKGWDRGSQWFMVDGLRKLGFRYFWSGEDVNLRRGHLNLLQADKPSKRVRLLYSNNRFDGSSKGGEKLYLWPSTWTFFKRDSFYELFSAKALDLLITEEGISLPHSYLDSYRKRGGYVNRSHFVKEKGRLVSRPGMEELYQRLEDRQNRGDLWVTGAGFLFRHMVSLPGISIEYEPTGSCSVINTNESAVEGLTLYLPKQSQFVKILVDGQRVPGERIRVIDGRIFFWFDLNKGATTTLELRSQQDELIPLMTAANIMPVD